MIFDLKEDYKKSRSLIKNRLKEFKAVWDGSDKEIFAELCFCICTPQSKAVYCDKAISVLVKKGILYSGTIEQVRKELVAVRFPNNKAKYIVEAREVFEGKGKIRIKDRIDAGDIRKTREWIVKNVKGIGFKEASHFLRNIGFGQDLAILDVHILKNMVKYGFVREMPKTISKTVYLALEEKFSSFAETVNIPMTELDLLLWSAETGLIFK